MASETNFENKIIFFQLNNLTLQYQSLCRQLVGLGETMLVEFSD